MVTSIARSLSSPLSNKLRINLGGDIATFDVVHQCYRQIGAAAVYNTFGNTEGAFLNSGCLDIEQVRKSGLAPVGRLSPGQALKLCAVNAQDQAANNGSQPCNDSEGVGELHLSSPGACSGYLGVAQSPAFYKDEQGREWYATGDQARVDTDGDVTIIGRYKDMIIRGGENISPAAVEAILSRYFSSLAIQIVGVPDTDGFAGQVPVAITQTTVGSSTTMAIREAVRQGMGSASCPEQVVSLAQLGLRHYPRTASRKVKRGELADIVRQYRAREKRHDVEGAVSEEAVPSATFERLRASWARILGIDESSLSPESHMAELADSIAATRLLDRVSKTFGKALTLAELTQADTLQQQADLVDSRIPLGGDTSTNPHPPTSRESWGPPATEDMVHLTENPEEFEATKRAIQQAIAHVGLTWGDVREVMPAHDMNRLSILLGQMNRMNLKTCFVIRDTSVSKKHLYDALEVVLANNTQLASFQALVPSPGPSSRDTVLHVVTSQTRPFLEQHVFRDGGVLDTVAELNRTALGRQFPEHTDATYPGPLIKIDVFSIRETQSLALLISSE